MNKKTITYCDLCDKQKQCIKMNDMLWSCLYCRKKYYTKEEIKQL